MARSGAGRSPVWKRLVFATPGCAAFAEDPRTRRLQAAIHLEGQHQVGQLRLLVALHGTVVAGRLQVAEVQPAALVGDRGDHHDAGCRSQRFGGGALERRQQQRGQGEVAEDVGAELQLEAVDGLEPLRRRHDAGVVEQQIERKAAFELAGGEGAHRCQAGEVENSQLRLGVGNLASQAFERGLPLIPVSTGEDDGGAGAGKLAGCGIADTAVGAGKDHAATDLAGDLGGVPCLFHLGIRYVLGKKSA